jgi:hypothetical protein
VASIYEVMRISITEQQTARSSIRSTAVCKYR